MTQIDHGETPKDTIEVLSRMGHGIGVRNTFVNGHKWMEAIAEFSKIPVFNMQCDIWHPTQSFADLYTIKEKFHNELKGRKFVISWTSAGKYMRPPLHGAVACRPHAAFWHGRNVSAPQGL